MFIIVLEQSWPLMVLLFFGQEDDLPVIMFCAQLEWLKESKKINTHHPSTQ
jgi:hypothetical protein